MCLKKYFSISARKGIEEWWDGHRKVMADEKLETVIQDYIIKMNMATLDYFGDNLTIWNVLFIY